MFSGEAYAFQVYAIGGGYQFLTKPDYQDAVSLFLKQKAKRKLSASALETLAIIAYKQPVSKPAIEQFLDGVVAADTPNLLNGRALTRAVCRQ